MAHSGLTIADTEAGVPWSTITGLSFRHMSNALDELGQELDDGLSDPPTHEPELTRRRSLASQSAWSTPESRHDDWVDEQENSIALDEYVLYLFLQVLADDIIVSKP